MFGFLGSGFGWDFGDLGFIESYGIGGFGYGIDVE